jgi:hypothetical protein
MNRAKNILNKLSESIKDFPNAKGLGYETRKIGSFTYMDIVHKQSGLHIVDLARTGPIVGVNKFVELADKIFSKIEWNRSKEEIVKDKDKVRKLHDEFMDSIKKENGKWVIK